MFLISLLSLSCLKELFTHPGNKALVGTRPHHGIAFPRASLAIGQQSGVVALPGAVQHCPAEVVENVTLEKDCRHHVWHRLSATPLKSTECSGLMNSTLNQQRMTCLKYDTEATLEPVGFVNLENTGSPAGWCPLIMNLCTLQPCQNAG